MMSKTHNRSQWPFAIYEVTIILPLWYLFEGLKVTSMVIFSAWSVAIAIKNGINILFGNIA